MSSREKILTRVKANQPKLIDYEQVNIKPVAFEDVVEKFKSMLISVGGAVIHAEGLDDVKKNISALFPGKTDILSNVAELNFENYAQYYLQDPHALENIKVAILEGEFGVAENGAVWITERTMIDRALPFICENLVLIVRRENIFATLHQAYERIGESDYNYGVFISGPSKTADIEQSLVLGAHGAKTMTVFILASP